MSSRIRQAGVEDALGIAEVQVRSWQAAYRGLLSADELDGLSVDARAERWTALLAQSDALSFTLVAEDGDGVVGFCSMVAPARDENLGPRVCELAAIYVDPARWRSGFGTALLDAALGRLDDDRWDEVTVWVFEDNAQARGFYAKHGFTSDDALKREGNHDPPEVRLRRPLVSAAVFLNRPRADCR